MRIVAGTLRGRNISAPEGQDTRPTTDRVREALFSSLYSLRGGFEGAVVLDAFAGSGALGIEALSRGASHAVFFERDKTAAAVLKRNLQSCALESFQAQVCQRDIVANPVLRQAPPFDLVFLDPPYKDSCEVVFSLMRSLADAGCICDDAIIVYEHAIKAKDEVAKAATEAGFEVQASRKYGKTGITVCRFNAACG